MRYWLRRPALVAVLILFLPAAGRSQPPDRQKLAADVKDIFTRNCYRCHGQNGARQGGFGDEAEKQAFVVGKTTDGKWAGLKTTVVET